MTSERLFCIILSWQFMLQKIEYWWKIDIGGKSRPMPAVCYEEIPSPPLYAFWYCQRVSGCKNSPVFEFQSRYMEHHFEARAMLPPILDVCVAAFCFAHFQLNRMFTKIILPNAVKSQQLSIERRFFKEISKIICFFDFLTDY